MACWSRARRSPPHSAEGTTLATAGATVSSGRWEESMSRRHEISRRHFLSGLAAAPALFVRDELPVVTKRVEKLYTVAGCRQPNDLHFTPEGLWILDQVDQPGNKVF